MTPCPAGEAPLFPALRWIEDPAPLPAPLNMALDELLQRSAAAAGPTLRTYRWEQPCLSLGYFGSAREASAIRPGLPLVRRATGGGTVLHGDDFTYALALPRHPGSGPTPTPCALYRKIHRALAGLLRGLGHDVSLAETDRTASACFAGWSRDDLLLEGRKIAGAAQRRNRSGLLLQGSLQGIIPPGDFAARFAAALARQVERAAWRPEEIAAARDLAAARYANPAWTGRRA